MSELPPRVHLITGGFPAGATAGHDINYARLRLLSLLEELGPTRTTVASDFSDLEKWLTGATLLITYVSGPFPSGADNEYLRQWLADGGRWFALHGTSGGKAARLDDGSGRRTMVKMPHHDTLGAFFLNHPPVRKFDVAVKSQHPVVADLPAKFEVADELYLIELQSPEDCEVLLTTELPTDPSPEGFGFVYEEDTSLLADGKTRVIGYAKPQGKGEITYIALGHCHSPTTGTQRFVDESVVPDTKTPPTFRGSWETEAFQQILKNAITWGLSSR